MGRLADAVEFGIRIAFLRAKAGIRVFLGDIESKSTAIQYLPLVSVVVDGTRRRGVCAVG